MANITAPSSDTLASAVRRAHLPGRCTQAKDATRGLSLELQQMIVDHLEPSDAIALRRVSRQWRDAVTSLVPLHRQLDKVGRSSYPFEPIRGRVRCASAQEVCSSLLQAQRVRLQRAHGFCNIFSVRVAPPDSGAKLVELSFDGAHGLVFGPSVPTQLFAFNKTHSHSTPVGRAAVQTVDACFSPTRSHFAVANAQGWVTVYRYRMPTPVGRRRAKPVFEKSFQVQGGVGRMTYTPDGTKLLVSGAADEGTTTLWDVHKANPTALRIAAAQESLTLAIFSPDGTHLAIASEDGQLCAYALGDGQVRPVASMRYQLGTTYVSFTQDNTHMAVGKRNGLAQVFDLARPHAPVCTLSSPSQSSVQQVQFVRGDDTLLTVRQNGTVELCDWRTLPLLERLVIEDPLPWAMSDVSCDKRYLLTLNQVEECGVLSLWDLHSPKPEPFRWLHGHHHLVSATFSNDGRFVVSQTAEAGIHFADFDPKLAGIAWVPKGDPVASLQPSCEPSAPPASGEARAPARYATPTPALRKRPAWMRRLFTLSQ